jgi:hypothetical protein
MISETWADARSLWDICPLERDEGVTLDLHLSTAAYGGDRTLARQKGTNMPKAKYILIACLTMLQVALVVRFAVAAPMAHGRFIDVHDPGYQVPGTVLIFDATAVNDGDSTGWFRICVIKVGPPYHEYFPNPRDSVTDEKAVHCSRTTPTDPGATITFESNKFRMLSVPSETFWVLLTVQQQAPISVSEDGNDLINLSVDELREIVITNLYA